jgi:biotin carboxylase
VSIGGAVLVIVGAGYTGKRRIYERIAALGTRIVLVDEPGHWSEQLVAEGIAARWLSAPITGNADTDAAAIVDALGRGAVKPDGVATFWETSVPVAARVAAALHLPGNPVEAVDAARSKVRTRELSERLGLPTPRARRVQSLDGLYAAAAEVGFPAVVKPEFGASAVGCVRVDSFDGLPGVYGIVRGELARTDVTYYFRAGNDLLLEQYLDGVEFDVDIVLDDGRCVFSSVSQNWPTAEPSFQETGLHCPPDHSARAVRRLVELCVQTAQAFGFRLGVLHVEGKCTSEGPRIVEINARLGGGRIHEVVEAVWGVDLIEAHVRGSLGLPQQLSPNRRPRCVVVNSIVHAPATGRLVALPFGEVTAEGELGMLLDIDAEVGQAVRGPEAVFSTVLAEVYLSAKNLKRARALAAQVLRDPPVVVASSEAAGDLLAD